MNRPLASMTPSKLPVRRTPSNQNEVAEKTPQTSENTKRKLRNVELDLKDARQKLLNLQGNIKLVLRENSFLQCNVIYWSCMLSLVQHPAARQSFYSFRE